MYRADQSGQLKSKVGLVVTGLIAVLAVGSAGAWAQDQALEVRRSVRTGLVSFLRAADGGPLELPDADGRVAAGPLEVLELHGHRFGITDPVKQLRVEDTRMDRLGHTRTHFQQIHKGVAVFSGQVYVHQDVDGRFMAINGDFYPLPESLGITPEVSATRAQQIARGGLVGARPTLETSQLTIVDPGWYGDAALGARLAWHIVLTDGDIALRQAFFVDALTGRVLDQWSKIHTDRDRRIFDAQETNAIPGTFRRGESDPVVGIAAVDGAYDLTGDVYDYYFRAFGYDSIDNRGSRLRVTVRWFDSRSCPNAFWDGSRAVFCSGVASDDVIGHEFQHGLTEFSAGLIYQNQSGQLNESYSDVFGEVIDLFNGGASLPGPPAANDWPQDEGRVAEPGLDTPNNLRTACSDSEEPLYPDGVRWLLAEEGEPFGGAIRDMWDPTCKGHPDRANSPLHTCLPRDNGGVHRGSGVPNHAFAILTDGKSFNGFDVTGIGIIKSAAVWFRALTVYMTVTTDFDDAYAALNQAAADLIGTFPNDPRTGQPSDFLFTLDDAVQVDLALQAVEMNTAGLCGQNITVLNTDLPVQCFGRVVVFEDDFEAGTNGWTVDHQGNSGPLPTVYDWEQMSDLPDGRAGTAWYCADPDVGGTLSGQSEAGVHRLYSPSIQLPAELNFPSLAFTHSMRVQPGFDGGNLSIKVNDGVWQSVPVSAFTHNPYNPFELRGSGTPGVNDNPLGGQPAFTGNGREWGRSVVSLLGLVEGGDTLQVRFDFGKDFGTGVDGWYVDDFEVYHCDTATDCNLNGQADDVDAARLAGPESIFLNRPARSDGRQSDADSQATGQVYIVGDDFVLTGPRFIHGVRIWGGYVVTNALNVADDFVVIIYSNDGGLPGDALYTERSVASTRRQTQNTINAPFSRFNEWEFTLTFAQPVALDPGSYFLVIYNQTFGSEDGFFWEAGATGEGTGHVFDTTVPATAWVADRFFDLAFELLGPSVGGDCNVNRVPDDCEPFNDCNDNGMLDLCDVPVSVSLQSAAISPLDVLNPQRHVIFVPRTVDGDVTLTITASADLAQSDQAIDVDINGTPVGRVFEVGAGSCSAEPDRAELVVTAAAFNSALLGNAAVINLTPTANVSGNLCPGSTFATVQVSFEASGSSSDCNANFAPDECELVNNDCNSNAIPDECDLSTNDVNTNGVPDDCDECVVDDDCLIEEFDDGIFCNGRAICQAGFCVSGPIPCQGTLPFCDEDGETCFQCFGDTDCGDGLFCNGRETCVDRLCVSSGDPCAGQTCDEDNTRCVACVTAGDCDDGLFCNGTETCTAQNTCQPGTGPCAVGTTCDETNDTCFECQQDADCDDGAFCNGAESCVSGSCQDGSDPCPDGACQESAEQCVDCLSDNDCTDGAFCNGSESCLNGQCIDGDLPCLGEDCCDEALNACGSCPCQSADDCDDSDECTDDVCDAGQCRNQVIARCRDADGDDIADEDDACPGTPAGDAVDGEGCACIQLDEDADGVNDCNDICPGSIGTGPIDGQGCLCSQRDDDGDGVNNCFDVCPGSAPGALVTGDGCPTVQADNDVDGDGVIDALDTCPNTPFGEIADTQGCSPIQRQEGGTEVGAPITGVDGNGQGLGQGGGSSGSGSAPCGFLGMVNLVVVTMGLAAWKGRRGRPGGF